MRIKKLVIVDIDVMVKNSLLLMVGNLMIMLLMKLFDIYFFCFIRNILSISIKLFVCFKYELLISSSKIYQF